MGVGWPQWPTGTCGIYWGRLVSDMTERVSFACANTFALSCMAFGCVGVQCVVHCLVSPRVIVTHNECSGAYKLDDALHISDNILHIIHNASLPPPHPSIYHSCYSYRRDPWICVGAPHSHWSREGTFGEDGWDFGRLGCQVHLIFFLFCCCWHSLVPMWTWCTSQRHPIMQPTNSTSIDCDTQQDVSCCIWGKSLSFILQLICCRRR